MNSIDHSYNPVFLGRINGLLIGIGMTLSPPHKDTQTNPFFGRVLIGGLSQFLSVLPTKSTLGISSSYEEVGKWVWKTIKSSNEHKSSNSIFSALGATLGSFALSILLTGSVQVGEGVVLSPLRLVTGGVVMAFGSRLEMGCMPGHGLSGMALLSMSSSGSVISMSGVVW